MSEWREVRLEEVVDVNAKIISKDYDGKILYIDISSVGNGFLKGYTEYDYKEAPNRARRIVRDGDIIYSTVRPNLKAFYKFPSNIPKNIIASTGFVVLSKKVGTSIKYIYYYMTTQSFVDYLTLIAKGAAYPAVGTDDFKKLKIKIPDLTTQEKIADVLSTYDELIENNNRRIEILEKTAEEIYKEWFIRMRFSGYENTKFKKGIPEGWEVKRLSEVIGVADGTHDTPRKVNVGVPLVTGKNIISGSIDFDSTYNISIEDFEKINIRSAIYKNDILYSNIGTIGLMAIVNEDNKYSVKNLIILKTSDYDFYEYIYLLFKSKASQDYFESVASGASQKFISLTEMRKYKILLPNNDILIKFKFNINNLFEEIKMLKQQNQNLIKQRDLLLPRLINGTIEVK